MRNILLEIEYDGTNYFGWQYQPKRKTVQGSIETALNKILQEPVNLNGASRTDTGVSALGQIANFHTNSRISVQKIQTALNSLLPRDIHIKKAYGVHLLFHARFDAKSKLYRYRIIFGRSPVHQRLAWEIKYRLDLSKMERASKLFLGVRDYNLFCSVKNENGVVNISKIDLIKNDDLIIEIEANRFLYKMVRRIIGSLVDIGRGKIAKNEIVKSLSGKKQHTFLVAPAAGLILVNVTY